MATNVQFLYSTYNVILSYAHRYEKSRYSFYVENLESFSRPQVRTWHPLSNSSSSLSMVSLHKGCCLSYKLFPKEPSRCFDHNVTLHHELLLVSDYDQHASDVGRYDAALRDFYSDVYHAIDRFSSWSVGSKQKLCTSYLGGSFNPTTKCRPWQRETSTFLR